MKPGDLGTDVKKLQEYLNRWGRKVRTNAPELIKDGDYGPITKQRVREFQEWATLDQTGVANPITIGTLTALVIPKNAP